MDPRSQKPRDFVATVRNLTEETKKSRLAQMKWFLKYEPLLEEYEKLQRETRELYKERYAEVKDDVITERERTCLPVPITSNGEYGWLATKPEFRLEKYGSFIVNYPNPLKNITLLPGNIPSLSAGKGFVW